MIGKCRTCLYIVHVTTMGTWTPGVTGAAGDQQGCWGSGIRESSTVQRMFQSIVYVQWTQLPTFLEELFQFVLERLEMLLWGFLAHHHHLFLTCCEEKLGIRLPQEHISAELVLCSMLLGISCAKL